MGNAAVEHIGVTRLESIDAVAHRDFDLPDDHYARLQQDVVHGGRFFPVVHVGD